MRYPKLSLALGAILASAALGLFAAPAEAGVTFSVNGGGNPEENVLLTAGAAGNPVFGVTNQTNATIRFDSDTTLVVPAQGQARIEAQTGLLSTLCISIEDALFDSFNDVEFNINAASDGSVLLQAFFGADELAAQSFNLDAAGQNRFRIRGTDGTAFTKVCLTSSSIIQDVRQIRLGGVRDDNNPGGGGDVVPEPGSMALLVGGILPIAGFLRRRRAARAEK